MPLHGNGVWDQPSAAIILTTTAQRCSLKIQFIVSSMGHLATPTPKTSKNQRFFIGFAQKYTFYRAPAPTSTVTPLELDGTLPGARKLQKTIRNSCFFEGFWLFGPSWLQHRPNMPQDASNMTPSWLNLAPSWFNLAPTWPQLGSTWHHLGPNLAQLGTISRLI